MKLRAMERFTVIKNEQKIIQKTLRSNLEKLTREEWKVPGVFKEDIRKVKQKLEVLDDDHYWGALVRARGHQLATGDTPTKRAMGLQQLNARRNEISQIEFEGRVTYVKHAVVKAFFHDYKGLFSFHGVDLEAFKTELLGAIPRIDEDSKERLEQPITPAEVESAIDNLNPGKSPGSDGLRAAFYRAFKTKLGRLLAVPF